MTPPICCTGIPQRLDDGRYQYKCGHVYSVVLRLCEEEKPVKKPVRNAQGRKAAA